MRGTHQMHHVVLILLQEIAMREEQQEEDEDEDEIQYHTEGERGRISMENTRTVTHSQTFVGEPWLVSFRLIQNTHVRIKRTFC